MKTNVTCLPTTVYVDGKSYPVRLSNNRWLEAAVNKANYPDRVTGKNRAELEAKIRDYHDVREAERQKAKDKVAADVARPKVEAYWGTDLVHIRGRHATTGKLLITVVDTGKKLSVSDTSLSAVGVDVEGVQALRIEQDDLAKRRYQLGKSFYEVIAGLRDETIEITYRAELDDFMAIYGDYTAIGETIHAAEEGIERQLAMAALPWVLKDDVPLSADSLTPEEYRAHHQAYATRAEAEEYVIVSARIEALGVEIKRADADFDYEAELARLEARS